MLRAFSYMIAIISPAYAQLFLYYIYLAYMFRPIRPSSGHLRYILNNCAYVGEIIAVVSFTFTMTGYKKGNIYSRTGYEG
jgi:hypothetical protein